MLTNVSAIHLFCTVISVPYSLKFKALPCRSGFLFFIALAVFFSFCSCTNKKQTATIIPVRSDTNMLQKAAANPYLPIDVSPADIVYFPVDYPVAKMDHKTAAMPVMRIIYSRPHKQGRVIFGSLLKYGEPWRLGANEATEIELFEPVTIEGKKIAKGRYVLYCIPQASQWTIVLNTNIYSWGLTVDTTKDLFHFTIPISHNNPPIEYFTMVFEKAAGGANLLMAWDDVVARLSFTL